ncbi:MAG TPA: fibronectin type III domain-containing protein, partial [Burkholderiales bacterium]|nr:fibronectin type III domain-containing protein [Burkholderiales bacterium]
MNEAIVLEPGIPGTEPNIGITPVRPTIGIGPNIGGFEPGVIVNPDVPITVSSQDPVVTGFSPDRGIAGDWVRIFGSNFFSVTNIEFDGIGSNNFIVDANSGGTIVSAQVPPGATTGRITVVRRPVPGGILFRGTSINDFFVRPRISRISPDPVQGAVTGFIRVDRMKMGMEDPDGPGFSPTKFKVRANLEAPSNLTAVAMGTVINLSWMDNSGAELGFVIERKDPMNGYMEIGQVGENTATFQDSRQLARNVTYTYRVRAFDATGKSVASNEASARLGGAGMTTFNDFNPKSG